MGRLFSYDSPIIQSINKIVDCAILSILWLVLGIVNTIIARRSSKKEDKA